MYVCVQITVTFLKVFCLTILSLFCFPGMCGGRHESGVGSQRRGDKETDEGRIEKGKEA